MPKPAEYRFPQGGWLRCSDEDASEWLKNLPPSLPPDGWSADALWETATQVAESGYFSPASLRDEREKKLRGIVERRGQPDFRNKLIAAYGGRCAVTGCDAVAALEAAHIVPYAGPQSNHVTNGLLLRADIHTLFDLDLIGIEPNSLTISVAPAIKTTVYAELDGKKLVLPVNAADIPNHEALAQRWGEFFGEKDGGG
jgi:predicted restriction endonuclease